LAPPSPTKPAAFPATPHHQNSQEKNSPLPNTPTTPYTQNQEDKTLRQQKEVVQQQWQEDNAQATIKTAKKDYPNETWLAAQTVKLRYVKLPKSLENISIGKSKFPLNKDDERVLLKEVKQAQVLTGKGSTVYLIPKAKDAFGNNIPGPDAIVNGRYIEFKTITGSLDRVETRFRESRKQDSNVFLKIDNPKLSKRDIFNKLSTVVNGKDYTGGFKGNAIIYISSTRKTYFLKISSLKHKKKG
jgi:hypothetical protein